MEAIDKYDALDKQTNILTIKPYKQTERLADGKI